MYTVAAIAEMTNLGLNPFGKYKKDFTSTPVRSSQFRRFLPIKMPLR
jgi:hypothetical protein